jgi:ferredoxin-NADP reductase
METATRTAPVLDIISETADTQTFRLGTYFDFQPGQAISLTIPGDPKKRFYSISSSPTEKNSIAITIKAAEKERALYGSLFSLKKGSPVEVAGPMGSFTLTPPIQSPLYFLAGGSGVAPFRSMIRYVLDTQPAVESWLIHSVRTPDDLIFKEEFLSWSQKIGTFRYLPTFTRWTDVDFKGETGRIGETLLRKHVNLSSGTFFLCGPKTFVSDMEHVLGTLSVPADRIRREQW